MLRQETFEVINFGVPGYDIKYAAHRFETRGAKYNPDLVLWMLNTDDLEANNDLSDQFIPYFRRKAQKEASSSAVSKDVYYEDYRQAKELIYREYGEEALINRELASLNDMLNSYSNPLVFLILNMKEKFEPYLLPLSEERQNIYYFDKLPDIYASLMVLPDGHPNEEGHSSIAWEIYTYLPKNINGLCN